MLFMAEPGANRYDVPQIYSVEAQASIFGVSLRIWDLNYQLDIDKDAENDIHISNTTETPHYIDCDNPHDMSQTFVC